MSYAPPEAMMPHPPGEIEGNEAKVEKKQVDLGKFNPTPETVIHNWEVLGDLGTAGKEDLKLEMLKSLNEPDEAFNARGKEAIAKRDDPENPDPADFDKIRHIVVLRKMLLGQDWRAEGAAEEARHYVNQRLEKISHDTTGLGKVKPQTEIIANTINVLQAQLGELTAAQKKLDEIIETGYPNLWEKIKPTIETTAEPAQSDKKESPDELATMFPEEAPPAEAGATVFTKNETADEQQEKTLSPDEKAELEAKRWVELEEAIKELLPKHFEKYLPAIIDVLADCGFNFTEQETQKLEKGRYQKVRQFNLFVDPSKTGLPKLMAELQSSPAGTVERRATQIVEIILETTKNTKDNNLRRAFEKMKTLGHWGFAENNDADAILEYLHEEDKTHAYGIYTKSDNLRHINAKTGEIKDREIDSSYVPRLENTKIVAAPIFTFDISKKQI